MFLLKTSKADGSSQRHIYDHRNRLERVVSRDVNDVYLGRVDFDYDTFNRMVKREDRSDSQTVIDNYFAGYDGINPTLEFEKEGYGNATRQDLQHRHWWGPQVDQLFADEQISDVSQAGEVLWALPDHLGTIRDIAKFDGTSFEIVNHRRYDSFGNLTDQTDPNNAIAFGYTGKYFDAYSGLSHHWNRWYAPQLGKWINEDPIGFAAGDTNLVRYVGNRILRYRDSNGLDWLDSSANFFAGWGDTLTLGGTDWLRDQWGINDGINHNSTSYGVGGGVAAGLAIGTGGAVVMARGVPLMARGGATGLTYLGFSSSTATTISTGTTTLALFGTGTIGAVNIAMDTHEAIADEDHARIAYNLSLILSGSLVSSLGGHGRILSEGMMGTASNAPRSFSLMAHLRYEWAMRYKRGLGPPNMSYWATAPTPLSGGFVITSTAALVPVDLITEHELEKVVE